MESAKLLLERFLEGEEDFGSEPSMWEISSVSIKSAHLQFLLGMGRYHAVSDYIDTRVRDMPSSEEVCGLASVVLRRCCGLTDMHVSYATRLLLMGARTDEPFFVKKQASQVASGRASSHGSEVKTRRMYQRKHYRQKNRSTPSSVVIRDAIMKKREQETEVEHKSDDHEDVTIISYFESTATLKELNGRTALHRAAAARQLAVVELLIACGANVKAQDNDGRSPLILAVLGRAALINKTSTLPTPSSSSSSSYSSSSVSIVSALLAVQAVRQSVDLTDSRGCTALDYAVYRSDYRAVRALLVAGAELAPPRLPPGIYSFPAINSSTAAVLREEELVGGGLVRDILLRSQEEKDDGPITDMEKQEEEQKESGGGGVVRRQVHREDITSQEVLQENRRFIDSSSISETVVGKENVVVGSSFSAPQVSGVASRTASVSGPSVDYRTSLTRLRVMCVLHRPRLTDMQLCRLILNGKAKEHQREKANKVSPTALIHASVHSTSTTKTAAAGRRPLTPSEIATARLRTVLTVPVSSSHQRSAGSYSEGVEEEEDLIALWDREAEEKVQQELQALGIAPLFSPLPAPPPLGSEGGTGQQKSITDIIADRLQPPASSSSHSKKLPANTSASTNQQHSSSSRSLSSSPLLQGGSSSARLLLSSREDLRSPSHSPSDKPLGTAEGEHNRENRREGIPVPPVLPQTEAASNTAHHIPTSGWEDASSSLASTNSTGNSTMRTSSMTTAPALLGPSHPTAPGIDPLLPATTTTPITSGSAAANKKAARRRRLLQLQHQYHTIPVSTTTATVDSASASSLLVLETQQHRTTAHPVDDIQRVRATRQQHRQTRLQLREQQRELREKEKWGEKLQELREDALKGYTVDYRLMHA